MAPLALPHCLGMPYWHHQLVLSWYLHQPESHQLSLKKVLLVLRETWTHRSDPRYTWIKIHFQSQNRNLPIFGKKYMPQSVCLPEGGIETLFGRIPFEHALSLYGASLTTSVQSKLASSKDQPCPSWQLSSCPSLELAAWPAGYFRRMGIV